jgi:hypothetical protein
MEGVKQLSIAALAMVTLAITSVIGITILRTFANATAIEDADVTPFITGLAVFGTFSTVVAIIIVGKLVLGILKEN